MNHGSIRRAGDAAWCAAEASNFNSIAAEMKIGRADLIQIVLREWPETNASLPVREIDEERETDGSA